MLPLGLLIQSHSLWPLPSTSRCPLAVLGATHSSSFTESLVPPGLGSALQLDTQAAGAGRLGGRARPDPQVEACSSGLPDFVPSPQPLPRPPPFLAWSWG